MPNNLPKQNYCCVPGATFYQEKEMYNLVEVQQLIPTRKLPEICVEYLVTERGQTFSRRY